MASGSFTLAELAKAAGVPVSIVRAYRAEGLLQPTRRLRGRSDDYGFQSEHLARLLFIKRALKHGLTLADVAQLVDSDALVTCGDVHAVTSRRLSEIVKCRDAGTPEAVALTVLLGLCAGKGSREDCKILQLLGPEEFADRASARARARSRGLARRGGQQPRAAP